MHRDLVWSRFYVLSMFSANKSPRYQIMSNAMIRQDTREESNIVSLLCKDFDHQNTCESAADYIQMQCHALFTPRPIWPAEYCLRPCMYVCPSVCLSVRPSVCYPKHVRVMSQKQIDGRSAKSLSSLLFLRGQGQRSRSPEVKRSKSLTSHISKTTGPNHSKQKPKCIASEGLSSHMPRVCIPPPV